MAKPRVFVTRRIPDRGLELVSEAAEADIWPAETPPPYEVLLEKVKGADGPRAPAPELSTGGREASAGDADGRRHPLALALLA